MMGGFVSDAERLRMLFWGGVSLEFGRLESEKGLWR